MENNKGEKTLLVTKYYLNEFTFGNPIAFGNVCLQ